MLLFDEQRDVADRLLREAGTLRRTSELLFRLLTQLPSGLLAQEPSHDSGREAGYDSAQQLLYGFPAARLVDALDDDLELFERQVRRLLQREFHWFIKVNRQIDASRKSLKTTITALSVSVELIDCLIADWWKWVAGVKGLDGWDRLYGDVADLRRRIVDILARLRPLHTRVSHVHFAAVN